MKPWEETWRAVNLEEEGYALVVPSGAVASFDQDGPRCALAAAAPDLARVLLAVEWSGDDPGDARRGDACIVCSRKSRNGHRPDCALDAALRKAGCR